VVKSDNKVLILIPPTLSVFDPPPLSVFDQRKWKKEEQMEYDLLVITNGQKGINVKK
jgi:hypothetical protein